MPVRTCPPQVNEYNLFVREDSLQFGEALASSRFPWKLTIENRGNTEVAISRLLVSCSCLETTLESLTIPAGQSRDLQLVVDASPKPSESPTPDVVGFGVTIQQP